MKNKFTNDNWLEDSNRRLKEGVWGKRVALIISIPIWIVLLLGMVLWASFSSSNKSNTETGTFIPDTFTVLINDKEAVVSEHEDGSYSTRVQLVNGNYRKIIKVNWK